MEIKHLDDDEATALVVMAKHIIRSDGVVADNEILDLVELGKAMGLKRFGMAMKKTKEFPTVAESLAFARKVKRPRARKLILTYLAAIAEGDVVDRGEDYLILQLQRAWDIVLDY